MSASNCGSEWNLSGGLTIRSPSFAIRDSGLRGNSSRDSFRLPGHGLIPLRLDDLRMIVRVRRQPSHIVNVSHGAFRGFSNRLYGPTEGGLPQPFPRRSTFGAGLVFVAHDPDVQVDDLVAVRSAAINCCQSAPALFDRDRSGWTPLFPESDAKSDRNGVVASDVAPMWVD